MAVANNLSKGSYFRYNDNIYFVEDIPIHVQPGKGGAYVKFDGVNFSTGERQSFKFRSSDKVEICDIQRKESALLYVTRKKACFEDDIEVDLDLIDPSLVGYLKEGMVVKFYYWEDELQRIVLPTELQDIVVANHKGNIKLQSGRTITGPAHIPVGEEIVFNHETNSFVRRLHGYNG